ncbi:M48 family metallopeptidase [Microlunatus speluncae]|uniref:M48 family metallopeptidase n=1 Tax=Microlunatus speluncae TaxID=2594267 RepID=UPI001C2D94A8|nr:M48 family metallopeptidase [Microlunatus speluncae]
MFNGSTSHGFFGQRRIRHPSETKLLVIGLLIGLIGLAIVATTAAAAPAGGVWDAIPEPFGTPLSLALLAPIPIWVFRALEYGKLRTQAVRMTPSQFPEGYRMVAEAARTFGLRRVPDAYVTLGNGTINAFAVGHGFRRFVAVNSDLFEVGGQARDPEALRFVIGHEVGHIAAGHTSYFRLVFTTLLRQLPILGPAFSRAQEYTADNFGYLAAAPGAPGVMGTLAAGKYLNAHVNFHELCDRAATEKGLWVHVVNWQLSHPPSTWRANALRDRSRPGRIWFRPGFGGGRKTQFVAALPAGGARSGRYPTPDEAIALLDRAAADGTVREQQFGRFPGVDYSQLPGIRDLQLAQPALSRSADAGPVPSDPGAA